MEPVSLPLLLASSHYAAPNETEHLDRLRMQKGVFLLVMNGPDWWRHLYEYEPYDWGPYCRQLATDLVNLTHEGALINDDIRYYHYGAYRTSTFGEDQWLSELPLSDYEEHFIRDVRKFVLRPFHDLLRDIYAAFPDYAVNSRYRIAAG